MPLLQSPPPPLARSPTLKSGFDSLACLEEGLSSACNHRDLDRPSTAHPYVPAGNPCFSSHHVRTGPLYHYLWGLKLRHSLPFVVTVTFLCLYFHSKLKIVHLHHRNRNRNPTLRSDADGLDFIALAFFFSAVFISIRIAFPRVNLVYRFITFFSHKLGSLAFPFLKYSLSSIVTAKKRGGTISGRGSPVIWTIGFKASTETLLKAGQGVQAYSNGDVYGGELHSGRYCGSGVYSFYMSGKYEGDWIDGKYDGYGVETWAQGSFYRGQYKRGLREGYGVFRFYTGDVYSGEWFHGQSHGRGMQKCGDGSKYVGEFKWGMKHGVGFYHFRNMDSYAGEYFADQMHGYGVYKFANGHQYEGAWHEGKRQGLGMYTFRNAEIQAGYWHAGMLQTPSILNESGVTTMVVAGHPKVPVNHSKVLHAVQEARGAATKAHELSSVYDRVKKAVARANQAANAAKEAAARAAQNNLSSALPSF